MRTIVSILALAVAAWLTPTAGTAEPKLIDTFQHWSVYSDGSGASRVCWVLSTPREWAGSREGLQRGDIQLTVSVRPAQNVASEVSYNSGYPFEAGSLVEVDVASDRFQLFTAGENAWTQSPEEDAQAVAAFQKGISAVVRGTSARGNTTTDSFSLLGFTRAWQRAGEVCKS